MLIVPRAKTPDRLKSLLLVVPELVVELELLQVRLTKRTVRRRRASSTQRGAVGNLQPGVLKTGGALAPSGRKRLRTPPGIHTTRWEQLVRL